MATVETLPCSRCKQTLPVSSFVHNRAATRGYQYYCRPCKATHMRTWRINGRRSTLIENVIDLLEIDDQWWTIAALQHRIGCHYDSIKRILIQARKDGLVVSRVSERDNRTNEWRHTQ